MNYNIPYYNFMPMSSAATIPLRGASRGLFSKLLGGFNISSILTNTQKTLNIVNQAIPVIKQVNPLVKNAKTMFKVMNEFKKVDINTDNNSTNKDNNSTNNVNADVNKGTDNGISVVDFQENNNGPVFFLN